MSCTSSNLMYVLIGDCCSENDELAYICEKIILEQLKNNFRTRSLWPCHIITSGGRSPSANKLKFIKNTVI